MRRFGWLFILIALLLPGSPSCASASTLTETEAPLLSENEFTRIVGTENCIVMYYNSELHAQTGRAKRIYGMTPLQLGDAWMRGMIAFKERMRSSVKFYAVNWKGFSAGAIAQIRVDIASGQASPESPGFVAYKRNGAIALRFREPARPDALAWFINEMMDVYIPSLPKDKGEYLYAAGWAYTDTASPYINVVNVRKESGDLYGRAEQVQIVNYESQRADDRFCSYERIYAANGALFGSVESCGEYGKVGYFDFDNKGKMQYRVKYQ